MKGITFTRIQPPKPEELFNVSSADATKYDFSVRRTLYRW